MSPMIEQLRGRTVPQLVVTVLLVLVDATGIAATLLGHRYLGRTLIGLGIVFLAPLMLWMRTTAAHGPPAGR